VHRPIEGTTKTLTIRHTRTGTWEAVSAWPPNLNGCPNVNALWAVDVGVTPVAPSSTGEPIANPRFFRTDEPARANAPCHWSNTAKGTPAHAKRCTAVAHSHERIAHHRNDVAHSLSRRLVNAVRMIVVAELTIARMINHHTPANRRADAARNHLTRSTHSKAARDGRR